jgi:PAS domain S-box-containing protein
MTSDHSSPLLLQNIAPAIIEAMSDGVLLMDDQWRIVYANTEITRTLEISLEQIIGKHLASIRDFSTLSLPATLEELRATGSRKIEQTLLLSSGAVRTVSMAFAFLETQMQESISPQHVLCVIRDISEQRRAEAYHNDIAPFREALLQSSEHFFARTDMQGQFVLCNSAYLSFLGYSEQDLIGKHFDMTLTTESRQVTHDAFRTLISQKHPVVSFEIGQITANNKIVYTQWEASLVYDTQGEPIYTQSIGYDITDRILHGQVLAEYNLMLTQQIEQQSETLYQSETAYSLVAQNMSDAIIVRDIQSKELLFVSPSIEHVLGYTQEEYKTTSFEMIAATPEDLWTLEKQYEDTVSTKSSVLSDIAESSIRIRARKKDGEIVWLESRRQVIKRENGAYAVMTILRDITRRVAVEDIAKQNEQKYRALMEYAGDAIFIADPTTGIIMEANKQAEILIGKPRYEIIGMHQSHLHPRTIDGVEVFREDKRHLDDHPQDIARKRTSVVKSDGTIVPVEIIANKIELHGNIVMQGLFRDISPQVRAEREIQEALRSEKIANELKSHFVTMASHQFRTPLTIIKANASIIEDILKQTAVSDERTASIAHNSFYRVYQEIDRIILMMNDVMSLGRIEAGKILFQPETVDMKRYVEEHITRYKVLDDKGNPLAFSVSTADGVAEYPVQLDRVLFTEVLTNLISNALKYSAGKPSPEVHLHYAASHITLAVKDYGIGIPPQDYDKMFENFSRAQNALHIQGTGLGLVISKQFVSLHGGEISFESILNRGTTFRVMLPRADSKVHTMRGGESKSA